MKDNKLIAEFMGFQHLEMYDDFDLQFHNDWNWLMPVVQKCYKTEESYNLHKDIEDAFIDNLEDRIKFVYKAIVEFIKGHNQSKKEKNEKI